MPITRAYAQAAEPGNFFVAGKNKIINGDFAINQRAFSSRTTDGYGFDRWTLLTSDGTVTYSAQTFTPGAAPVEGYEATNFARIVSTGQTSSGAYSILAQRIEDVRTFAGQRITISFWAKASSGTPKVSVNVYQSFGSGGSTGLYSYPDTSALQNVTINTSWTRYSFSISVASISGKTIGTGSFLQAYLWTSAGTTFNAQTNSMGIQSATIDFWGVQVEAGYVATPFQTASGSLGGELALCQRYYWRRSATGRTTLGNGVGESSTTAWIVFGFPTEMRAVPTTVEWSGLTVSDGVSYTETVTSINGATLSANRSYGRITFTTAGNIVQNRVAVGETASGGGYFALGAEL